MTGTKHERHIFGVGPAVVGPGLVWLFAAWFVGGRLHWTGDGHGWTLAARIAGVALVAAGAVSYAATMSGLRRAVRGELVTTGSYAWCRHPLYAIWIFLLLPGGACLVGNGPAFLAPFLAAALFRALIRREEAELEARFGQAYRDYSTRVGRLWPRRMPTG